MSRRMLSALMAAAVTAVMGTSSVTHASTHVHHAAKAPAHNPDTGNGIPAPVELYEDAWDIPDSVQVVPAPDGSGTVIIGAEIGTIWGGSTAEQVQSWIEDPDGDETVRIVNSDGEEIGLDEQVCTGMTAEVVSADGEIVQQSEIAVSGDVTGSGEIGLTQIGRLARALADDSALSGAYRLAADVNDDGAITVADIVQLTQIHHNNVFEVDCVVTGDDLTDVLEAAGYDMEPWAEELAVVSARIPDSVDVSMIEWTQHDVFPGGMEQTQFYEGLERTLIFSTHDEGSTTVTAVVMTESGKSVERETEINWQDVPVTRT